MSARAQSVTATGEDDGWEIPTAYFAEVDNRGETRLVVSVQPERLQEVHLALVRALAPPLGVLWRQVVDRRAPRPEGSKPVDHLALDVPVDRVLATLERCAGVVYRDARAELWLKGRFHEQLVLDGDGLVYVYPDDLAFRDALDQLGLIEADVTTMAQRDYVKHSFHAPHDAEEDQLMRDLGLTRTIRSGTRP